MWGVDITHLRAGESCTPNFEGIDYVYTLTSDVRGEGRSMATGKKRTLRLGSDMSTRVFVGTEVVAGTVVSVSCGAIAGKRYYRVKFNNGDVYNYTADEVGEALLPEKGP